MRREAILVAGEQMTVQPSSSYLLLTEYLSCDWPLLTFSQSKKKKNQLPFLHIETGIIHHLVQPKEYAYNFVCYLLEQKF